MVGLINIYGLLFVVLQLISIPIIACGHKYDIHHLRVFGYGFFSVITLVSVLYNTFS